MDAILELLEGAGLVEVYVNADDKQAMRLTDDGARLARQMTMSEDPDARLARLGAEGDMDRRQARAHEQAIVCGAPVGSEGRQSVPRGPTHRSVGALGLPECPRRVGDGLPRCQPVVVLTSAAVPPPDSRSAIRANSFSSPWKLPG
jgi:hypothetical protein